MNIVGYSKKKKKKLVDTIEMVSRAKKTIKIKMKNFYKKKIVISKN